MLYHSSLIATNFFKKIGKNIIFNIWKSLYAPKNLSERML